METDVAKLELHTGGSIRAIVDRLHEVAQSGDSGLLARLEKAHGFNYDPEWILLDQNLSIDLPSLWMWDWFHTYLADGIFVQEVDACMEAFCICIAYFPYQLMPDQRTYKCIGAYAK